MSEKIPYDPDWDLTDIPQKELVSEYKRRISLKSIGLSGRPRSCGHEKDDFVEGCSYCERAKKRLDKKVEAGTNLVSDEISPP